MYSKDTDQSRAEKYERYYNDDDRDNVYEERVCQEVAVKLLVYFFLLVSSIMVIIILYRSRIDQG